MDLQLCPQVNTIHNCSIDATYIRPDSAISIIPWLYSLVLLIVHLPLILIRVLKWETGQVWSLAMATLSIALTILSFHSTGLAAEKVYIWMPVALAVDVGAVMQVFILIIEEAEREGEEKDGRRIWRYIARRRSSFQQVANLEPKDIEIGTPP